MKNVIKYLNFILLVMGGIIILFSSILYLGSKEQYDG